MAKWANDLVMDAALDYIATATRIFVCSAQPATYAEASSTYDLATGTIDGTDFTKANGDSSGRKVTVSAQSGLAVDHSGTATHIAIGIASGSELVYVTTCTSQALTAGNTVNVPAWDVEIADPT
jgi:hypothetical protein